MFAVLELQDFTWLLFMLILVFTIFAGGRAAYARAQPSGTAGLRRLRRLEAKVDLILKQLGLEYQDTAATGGLSDDVKALADNPARKIEAIALYRQETGVGLKEAKDAVETYMADRR